MNDLTIYDTLAESWWQAGSPLHLLARMNPARFAYFDPLVRHWSGLRVLDVGCGGGLAAVCLVQRGAHVVGLDLSRASLHIAACQTRQPGCPEAVFTCGRAEALPFADASFEVVWCTDVLEHLTDCSAAIAQIARVLKPGGLFLYDTINRSWLSRLLVIGFWEYLARVAPRGTHDWQLFLTPPELHHLLCHHGLQPGAIQGMLPVWWSPWHGWRFGLIQYTGILYLGSAVKPAGQLRAHRWLARRPGWMASLLLLLDGRPWLRRGVMRLLTAEPAHFARLVALHMGSLSPRSGVKGLSLAHDRR
jgi:2-polyprenyl-6-hydroxyphenyl methylase/3-demethylubiquinone-9 3-methyltransferase